MSCVLGLVPHRSLMLKEHNIQGGAQHSPIRLVFQIELGPRPCYVVGFGGPRPVGRWIVVEQVGLHPLRTITSCMRAHGQET